MSYWVYILECADGSYYTGHSDNLEARLKQHEQGIITGYTTKRRPVKLVFCSEFYTRDDAFARERQIKGWSRVKKQALIRQDWVKLVEYSKSNNIYLPAYHPSTGLGRHSNTTDTTN